MSNKNTIARTAAAVAEMEAAVEAVRQEHADVSMKRIEATLASFAYVVRNTRRKMTRPSGFDWAALHHSFKVVAITETHLRVEAVTTRGRERAVLDVPRGDLSLSMWQVTSLIRRLSAERLLGELNATVAERERAAAKIRKEIKEAEKTLSEAEDLLSDAKAVMDRRVARARAVEAKREATRARRKADVLELVAPELVAAQ